MRYKFKSMMAVVVAMMLILSVATVGAQLDSQSYVDQLPEEYANTYFDPDEPMSRAEGITILWRSKGSPLSTTVSGFDDVAVDKYFTEAVDWARDSEITVGISTTEFGPDIAMTRGVYLTFLWRMSGSPVNSVGVTSNIFYDQAVNWAYIKGLIGDTSTAVEPITRSQAITILWRLLGSPETAQEAPFVDVTPDRYFAGAIDWGYSVGVITGVGIDPNSDYNWDPEVEAATMLVAIRYGFNIDEVFLIGQCESSGDPNSINRYNSNGTWDYGLMMHNSAYIAERFARYGYDWVTTWMDPMINLRVAAEYRLEIGRWGGSNGWACASKVGLY